MASLSPVPHPPPQPQRPQPPLGGNCPGRRVTLMVHVRAHHWADLQDTARGRARCPSHRQTAPAGLPPEEARGPRGLGTLTPALGSLLALPRPLGTAPLIQPHPAVPGARTFNLEAAHSDE